MVYISEKKHTRAATGHIKLMADKNPKWAMFSPMDSRVPRMFVAMADCPQSKYFMPTKQIAIPVQDLKFCKNYKKTERLFCRFLTETRGSRSCAVCGKNVKMGGKVTIS